MSLEDYEIEAKIGTGKYSSVYRVKRIKDSQLFAMKKISIRMISQRQQKNAMLQIKLLSSIKHPNIIELIEAFYDDYIEALCIILEYADDGDIAKKLEQKSERQQSFSEAQIWKYVTAISSGLSFMHSNNVIHRDIKANNIFLFSNGNIKIGDLNVSKLTPNFAYTRTGTLSYASPQIWKNEAYNFKTDIWSFGCLIYEIVRIKKPFYEENMFDMSKKVLKGNYEKITQKYSRELKDLIAFMIQVNSRLRPSSTTILKMSESFQKKNDLIPQKQISPKKYGTFKFLNQELNLNDISKVSLRRIHTEVSQDHNYTLNPIKKNIIVNSQKQQILSRKNILKPILDNIREKRKMKGNRKLVYCRKIQEKIDTVQVKLQHQSLQKHTLKRKRQNNFSKIRPFNGSFIGGKQSNMKNNKIKIEEDEDEEEFQLPRSNTHV